MNGWLAAAAAVLAGGVGASVWGVATGPLRRRVTAQNLVTSLVCLVVLLLAQGFARPAYVDVALVLALLGPVGTLVYARLLADDLRADPPLARVPTAVAALATAGLTIALAAVAGPGRAAVKLLAVGALLIAGNLVATYALSGGVPHRGTTPNAEARHD